MRRRFRVGAGIGAALVWAVALGPESGCGSPPPAEPIRTQTSSATGFSGARALELTRSLGALGERPVGSEQADAARKQLRDALAGLGLEVEAVSPEPVSEDEVERSTLVPLLSRIPGRDSRDAFLLVATYAGAWEEPRPGSCEAETRAASGAALLVEIARSLAANPLPYGVWLGFVEEPGARELEAGERPGRGVSLLGRALHESGEIERVRLSIFFTGVAERDLVVARDLYSHRTFRERFFRTASKLGREDTFPSKAGFTSPTGGHRIFLAYGYRSVLAIAPEPPPEPLAGEPSDPDAPEPEQPDSAAALEACSAESLEAVGDVTLAALADVSELLLKVDRFVRGGPNSVEEVPAEEPLPEAGVESSDPTPQADREAEGSE